MTAIWTRLTAWWRWIASGGCWGGDAPAAGLPPELLPKIDATVAKLEATFTQRTVEQIQAELRAAAAEDRLDDYTAGWLQGSVEELSADLLRVRHADRSTAAAGQVGRSDLDL